MYLNFNRYQELGGKLSEVDFTRYLFLAQNKINRMTQNRIVGDMAVWDALPYAEALEYLTFDMIGLCASRVKLTETGAVVSESNAGVSKTFREVASEDVDVQEFAMACEYLYGIPDHNSVGLMFLGTTS